MRNEDLTLQIIKLFRERKASSGEGTTALVMLLFATLAADGFKKEKAFKMLSAMWDTLEPFEGLRDAKEHPPARH
jgi:hypothetical protein